MNQNAITIIVVTASAILNFLLTQPPGTFSPTVMLVIGALSVGLTAIARFLPTAPSAPQQVQITGSVPVTPAKEGEG